MTSRPPPHPRDVSVMTLQPRLARRSLRRGRTPRAATRIHVRHTSIATRYAPSPVVLLSRPYEPLFANELASAIRRHGGPQRTAGGWSAPLRAWWVSPDIWPAVFADLGAAGWVFSGSVSPAGDTDGRQA